MEPTTSAPTPESSTSSMPSPKGGSRKKLIIIGVAVLVVIIVAIIIGVVAGGKKSDKASTNDTSLYYDRAGYDRSKLRADVGDPMAIKTAPGDKPQSLVSGTVIVQACSLLTQDDLTKAGIKLYANAFGYPFIQNYLDESGEAKFAADPNHMLGASDTMSCNYGIEDGKIVNVAVNQPFTATDGAVASDIDLLHYNKQADQGGFQIYTRTSALGDDKTSYTLLRKNNTTIEVKLPESTDPKITGLVKTVMSNFDAFTQHPKGVSTVSYSTPTFTQSYAKACDLVDNADMKNLTGVDASPLVRSFWPSGTGVADFSKVSSDKVKTNYLRSQCIRTSNDPSYKTLIGIKTHTLQVTTTTYENNTAAAEGLKYIGVGEGNDSAVKESGIGEEAYLYKTPNEDKQLALGFRQGRVVVELISDFASQNSMDKTSYGAKLTPVAEKIAAQLKNLH